MANEHAKPAPFTPSEWALLMEEARRIDRAADARFTAALHNGPNGDTWRAIDEAILEVTHGMGRDRTQRSHG